MSKLPSYINRFVICSLLVTVWDLNSFQWLELRSGVLLVFWANRYLKKRRDIILQSFFACGRILMTWIFAKFYVCETHMTFEVTNHRDRIKMRSKRNCMALLSQRSPSVHFSDLIFKVAIQPKWKWLWTVILPLLSKQKSNCAFQRLFVTVSIQWKWKDYHLSCWLCFYIRRPTVQKSPQKDAPSSQVLNELAEGTVRRTGGRLALAFRIFLGGFAPQTPLHIDCFG